jgi:NAD(P)-dependent dehydrogenase (short-subunit alcohol dehydrogenase family)
MPTQVVLITGALTGIGRATAIAFAQDGVHVVVSGRRDKEGQDLAAELAGLGAEAIFVRSDVRSEDDVRDLVDRALVRFGGWMLLSIAPERKADLAPSRSKRQKPTPRPSTQTSWAPC